MTVSGCQYYQNPLTLLAKMIAQIYLPNENYKIGRQ